jgi:hypothetical protein
MKRKMTPEERRAYEAQKAEWAQTSREMKAIHERLLERWRADDERRARRRRLLRRLLPFAR